MIPAFGVLCCALGASHLANLRAPGTVVASTLAQSTASQSASFRRSAMFATPVRPRLTNRRASGIVATSTAAPSRKFPPSATLIDGRTFRVFEPGRASSVYLAARVEELLATSIEAKGAVSLSIGSGTTVEPLAGTDGTTIIELESHDCVKSNMSPPPVHIEMRDVIK